MGASSAALQDDAMANTDDMGNMDPETQAAILKGIDELERELANLREEMAASFGALNSLLSSVESAVVRLSIAARQKPGKVPLTPDDIPGETAGDKLVYLLNQMRPQHSDPEKP
jgi:hypothetical protein